MLELIRQPLGDCVRMVGRILHRYLAPKPPEYPPNDIWKMRNEQAEAIANPLARIVARRIQLGERAGDVLDGAAVALAVGDYALEAAEQTAELHRLAPAPTVPPEEGIA